MSYFKLKRVQKNQDMPANPKQNARAISNKPSKGGRGIGYLLTYMIQNNLVLVCYLGGILITFYRCSWLG